MTKIDMHVHTAFSERPSEWFLKRIGAKESYSRPEQAYATAIKRGMDFVTITDHNRIDGALLLKGLEGLVDKRDYHGVEKRAPLADIRNLVTNKLSTGDVSVRNTPG